MIALKNSIKRFIWRLNHTKWRTSYLEDRTFEIIQLEKQTLKQKSKESLQSIRDIIKRNNIHTIGVPEGEKKGTGSTLKAIWLNLAKPGERKRHPHPGATKNSKQVELRHTIMCLRRIIMKWSKVKNKNFESNKRKDKLHTREPP